MKPARKKYSKEALFEIFETPNPSDSAIAKWRQSWKHSPCRIGVKNYRSAYKILMHSHIDPLFYQVSADEHDKFVVFYRDEDRFYFQMESNND